MSTVRASQRSASGSPSRGNTVYPSHTHTHEEAACFHNKPALYFTSKHGGAGLRGTLFSSLLVTWPHSAAHNVKHKDGSVLGAHKQPHCLMSGSGFISISGAGRPGWWWWRGLRFSGGGRQYRPLVLFPSNAAQGLGALQPRSPLDSQSSGGAALPGRAEEVGCTEPTAAGSNSHIALLFPCSAASGRVCVCWVCTCVCVCVGGSRMGKDPKNTCGQHSCQVISGKEGGWGCVCACMCVHVRALRSREVVVGAGGWYYHRTTHKECPVDYHAPPPHPQTPVRL